MDVAKQHLTLMSGLFHAEAVTRDKMLEVQEIDHLTEIIYDQAHIELNYVNDFINRVAVCPLCEMDLQQLTDRAKKTREKERFSGRWRPVEG